MALVLERARAALTLARRRVTSPKERDGAAGQRRRAAGWLTALTCLVAPPVWAHAPSFDFYSPEGLENEVVPGTLVSVRWQAWVSSDDPDRDKTLLLSASSGAVAEWREDQALLIPLMPAPVPVVRGPQEMSWDTRGLSPGCYQLHAVVSDSGGTYPPYVGIGKLTVRAPGFVPPSVWFTNEMGEELDPSGHFVVRYRVRDPDSVTKVTLSIGDGTSLRVLAEGLEHPVGGGEGTFLLDATSLENRYYELHARAEAEGEPACEAFWRDLLYVIGGPYASPDGGGSGADAGPPKEGDGDSGTPIEPPGEPDAGRGPGDMEPPGEPAGGCGAARGGGGALGFAMLLSWLRTTRQARGSHLAAGAPSIAAVREDGPRPPLALLERAR